MILAPAVQVELVTEGCFSCGIQFAMPADLRRRRLSDLKPFHCPNGHSLVFTKSEADNLREQLESMTLSRNNWLDDYHAAERRIRSLKGALTKAKRRVAR